MGPGIKTGMPIRYDNPREVGADRIVNAVAVYERFRSELIAVDFGTATTFDYINKAGEYEGGVITPGVKIAAEALFHQASKLFRVELVAPPWVIAKDTASAIQSGIVYGYASLVDGILAADVRRTGISTNSRGYRRTRQGDMFRDQICGRNRRRPDHGRPSYTVSEECSTEETLIAPEPLTLRGRITEPDFAAHDQYRGVNRIMRRNFFAQLRKATSSAPSLVFHKNPLRFFRE